MRGRGKGLAVMAHRALARFVARRDILHLAVAGSGRSDLAAMRVLVRLRGRDGLDSGTLLAFGRSLRAMLGLQPGSGLPLLVISLAAEDAAESADADRPNGAGCVAKCLWQRRAGLARLASVILPFGGLSDALKRKRRRLRSPPSPWSVSLSACG